MNLYFKYALSKYWVLLTTHLSLINKQTKRQKGKEITLLVLMESDQTSQCWSREVTNNSYGGCEGPWIYRGHYGTAGTCVIIGTKHSW